MGELDHAARSFIDMVAAGRIDDALSRVDSVSVPPDVRLRLVEARDSLNAGTRDTLSLVGWTVMAGNPVQGALTYQVRVGVRWLLVTVELVSLNGSPRIAGLTWTPQAATLSQLNTFTLSGRSLRHWIFLVLALGATSVSLWAAYLAIRLRKGWRWVVLCLIGVTKASINWTTGAMTIKYLSFQLLGAGWHRQGSIGPWWVSFSLPIGAIALLLDSRERNRKPPVQNEQEQRSVT